MKGKIAFVGSPEEREQKLGALADTPRLDANGGTLVPGFVDPHTHLPWAGSREEEFRMRLAGKTYMEIAAAGGGILSTVRSTREADRGGAEPGCRAPTGSDAETRHHHSRGQEWLRSEPRGRDQTAASHPGDLRAARGRPRADACWPPTKHRPSTAMTVQATSTWSATRSFQRCEKQDWPVSATSSAKKVCSRPTSRDAFWRPGGNTAWRRGSTPTSS